jgi:nucleoside-diphosphate-sugar epimerase
MKTKVLVTGSEGFIGGYVVAELLSKGYSVVGIDSLQKYGTISRKTQPEEDYNLVIGDAKDTDLLEKLAKDADFIIAGAAKIGGISYFHTYAYDLLAENERIIASTCDAAIRVFKKPNSSLKKVLYLSSSMVFENTSNWPSVEGDEKLIPPPTSSYGFQKLSVEYFARAAWDQYGLPFTICRPFNCVGIGERKALGDKTITSGGIKLAMSHVIPDLIQKILRGQEPLRIYGDGNQMRHYTYGGDLAEGILLALENPKALNEDFNLSTKEGTSVNELAMKIWAKINPGRPLRLIHEDPFIHDVHQRIPSVEKAGKILNFHAETTLDAMLDIVIPWVVEAVKQGSI